jgi:thioesterase domain-containing protein/acyl carrier protein
MYKTGDLVRRGMDGWMEFLGRLDHQVKVRGFRIELGEIETVLRQHPDVRDAVVVAHAGRPGEKRLVAYVTAMDSSPLPTAGLRDLLRQNLPPYMMPSAFVAVDQFPTTLNGKIDRQALPSPDDHVCRDTSVAYVAPGTPTEELLAAFWRDRLGLGQIGIYDNFFDLGGDSLATLQLSLEIERATGQTVPMTSIFDAPTIAGMAAILDGQPSATDASPLVVLRPGTEGPPVFIIHPVGGSTMQLIPIAKTFPGRRRVYGVQARGLDGTERPIDRVDAMADHYLKAIKQAQPQGPYLFAGMCFGGLIALEIARRLLERGDTIGLLACLDTYPHPRYWPLSAKIGYFVIRRVKETVSTLKLLSPREAGVYIMARFKALSQKIASRIKGRQAFIAAPESLPPALKAVFDAGVTALVNYRPRFYPGKVSFLMCGYHAYMPEGPRSVWAHLIGNLDVRSAPAWASPDYIAQWLFDRIQDAEREDFRLHEGCGEPMAGLNASYSKSIAVPAELVTADGPAMALRPGGGMFEAEDC